MENYYVESAFYGSVIIGILLYQIIRRWFSTQSKQIAFIGLNIFFLFQLKEANQFFPLLIGYLICVIGFGYLIFQSKSKRQQKLTFRIGIVFCLSTLALFKYPNYIYLIIGEKNALRTLSTMEWVGLSYLTFRAIDFLIMVRTKRIKEFNLLVICSYFIFFAPFVSGPINRFLPFIKNQIVPDTPLDFARVRRNLLRISTGVIKILFLSKLAYANSIIAPEFQIIQPVDAIVLTWSVYAYFFYIYFEFSGYCDVAISIADFFGINVPENFEYPFLASNIQDFWNRWHISLSQWMRDHVFFPLTIYLTTRQIIPKLAVSCFSILVTFFLIGIWHGNSLNWALYGLYHGTGLALYMLYNQAFKTRFPIFFEKLSDNASYKFICILATFNFVAWGFLLTLELQKAKNILDNPSSISLIDESYATLPINLFFSEIEAKKTSRGILVSPLPEAKNSPLLLLGGGTWNILSSTDGWELIPRAYYRGSLTGNMSTEGAIDVFCLMYNNEGQLIRQKPLGVIRSYALPIIFDFAGIDGATRFNIALSAKLENWPKELTLTKLKIEKIN
jgi:D-alanyl-lipoteichoic acid acyltransferase DltB (MBOAT superfamily)